MNIQREITSLFFDNKSDLLYIGTDQGVISIDPDIMKVCKKYISVNE